MDERAIGRRVSVLRSAEGMTQQELADSLGKSLIWLKKFEAGDVQSDPRLSTLKAMAQALHVPLIELLDEHPSGSPSGTDVCDTTMVRAALLAPPLTARACEDPSILWRRAQYSFDCFQTGNYTALLELLPDLIAEARAVPEDPNSARSAYRAHHVAAITLMKFNGGPAAWTAAQRAVDLATASTDPVLLALAVQAQTYTMTTIGEARIGMENAIDYARQLEATLISKAVAGNTALGMLWLKAAVAAAECGEASTARDLLARAEQCAEHVPIGANYMKTGFDALNVLLYQVSVDAALNRFGPAASGADQVNDQMLGVLPRERRAHHLIEAAATYTALRRPDDALAALLHAEADSPQEVRTLPAAREVISNLLHASEPVPERLRALMKRCGVEP